MTSSLMSLLLIHGRLEPSSCSYSHGRYDQPSPAPCWLDGLRRSKDGPCFLAPSSHQLFTVVRAAAIVSAAPYEFGAIPTGMDGRKLRPEEQGPASVIYSAQQDYDEPAGPYADPTSVLPRYKPIRNFPTVKSMLLSPDPPPHRVSASRLCRVADRGHTSGGSK